ncbi:MAG: HIRAN domain-containing protein [Thermoleophilia bacterium]|jgi:hypothetical protein
MVKAIWPGLEETKRRMAPLSPDYADPREYHPPPILFLRGWDYGEGTGTTAYGYGLETPDGRIWQVRNCRPGQWQDLGVLVLDVVGDRRHLDALQDRSFDPGHSLILIPEPDQGHDSTILSVRNAEGSITAGYIPRALATRLPILLRGQDFKVMSFRYHLDTGGRRRDMKLVVFRPDRLIGTESLPLHPGL